MCIRKCNTGSLAQPSCLAKEECTALLRVLNTWLGYRRNIFTRRSDSHRGQPMHSLPLIKGCRFLLLHDDSQKPRLAERWELHQILTCLQTDSHVVFKKREKKKRKGVSQKLAGRSFLKEGINCAAVKVFRSSLRTTCSNSSRFSWSPQPPSSCVSPSSRSSTAPLFYLFFVCLPDAGCSVVHTMPPDCQLFVHEGNV